MSFSELGGVLSGEGALTGVLGPGDLCSDQMILDLLTEVEEFIDSDLNDPVKLQEMKLQAKAYLEDRSGRRILWKEVVLEKHDGNEKPFLYVAEPPILQVSTLEWWQTPTATVLLVEGTDYWVYRDHVKLLVPTTRGYQNYLISYRSGLAWEVSLITQMTIAMVVARSATISAGVGGTSSESITAGPVSIRDVYPSDGKYAKKIASWTREINAWVGSRGGVRIGAIGHQKHKDAVPLTFNPRIHRGF